ncbi:MAG: response regulator [bacterium]|nr:response regulator [bacterium]
MIYLKQMEDAKIFTILMVDDEKDFRDIVSTKLKTLGINVIEAENGQEGLKKLKEVKPDLLLLDVNMPVMNGIETLSTIRKDPELNELKIILLTNYGDPQKEAAWQDERLAREAGAMDYIRKTDDLDTIASQVISVLRGHESPGK